MLFRSAIDGIAAACEAVGAPVVSGNVSLFNESDGTAIHPTPVVGAVGLLDDVSKAVAMGFQGPDDSVYLIAPGCDNAATEGQSASLVGDAADLAGSEYLRQVHGLTAGQPRIDLDLEARLQKALLQASDQRLLRSAHDCSHGGLAVALAEACLAGGVGFAGTASVRGRLDSALFGEAASRVVVSVRREDETRLEALLREEKLPFAVIGRTGGDRLRLPPYIDTPVDGLRQVYESGLEGALAGTGGQPRGRG